MIGELSEIDGYLDRTLAFTRTPINSSGLTPKVGAQAIRCEEWLRWTLERSNALTSTTSIRGV
jgi:hypothetical protein